MDFKRYYADLTDRNKTTDELADLLETINTEIENEQTELNTQITELNNTISERDNTINTLNTQINDAAVKYSELENKYRERFISGDRTDEEKTSDSLEYMSAIDKLFG